MKKLLSIFSLLILTFSNIIPAYTYADSGDNELAIEILSEELDNTLNEFNNNSNGELTNNLEQASEINTQNTIDWYQCFGITSGSTEATVNKYNCEYENITVPGNIKYLNSSVFSGKNIDTITFLNEETKINGESFKGSTIIGNVTLPGNQEYNELSALEGITISKSGILTVNKQATIGYTTNHGKIILDGSNWTMSNGVFNYSTIDGEVIFSGFNDFTVSQSFNNGTIKENSKITFKEGIKGLNTCFSSTEINNTKIEFYEKTNFNQTFKYGIIKGLELSGSLGIINGSLSEGDINLTGNLKAKSIKYSATNAKLNGNLYLEPDGTDDDFLNGTFNGGLISGDINIIGNATSNATNAFAGATIKGNVTISGNNLDLKSGTYLVSSSISGDVNIYGENVTGGSVITNSKIDGNINIKGKSIRLTSGILDSTIIGKNLNISGDNTFIDGSFNGIKVGEDIRISSIIFTGRQQVFCGNTSISGDLNIRSNNATLDTIGQSMKINGETKIIGNDIKITSASFSSAKIQKNLYISGNNIKIENGAFGEVETLENITIKGVNIKGKSGSANYLTTKGNLNIEGTNIELSEGFLGTCKATKNINIKSKTLTGNGGAMAACKADEDIEIIGENITIDNGFLNGILVGKNLNISGNIITGGQIINSNNRENSAIESASISGNINLNSNIAEIKNLLKNSLINGDIIIIGNEILLTGETLNNTVIKGKATLDIDNFTGDNIFSGSNIYGDVKILCNNSTFKNGSFYRSNVGGDLQITGNTTLTKDRYSNKGGTFENSNISGNIKIHGENITIDNLSLKGSTIGKNIEIKANRFKGGAQGLAESKTSGDIKIEGNYILMENSFIGTFGGEGPKIGGNMYISGDSINTQGGGVSNFKLDNSLYIIGNNLNLENGFSNIKIGKDLNIYANNLTGQGSTFGSTKINGNAIIKGNNILLTNNWFSSSTTIDGDLNIIGKNIVSRAGGLNGLKIGGNSLFSGEIIDLSVFALQDLETTGSIYLYANNINFDSYVLKNAKIKKDLRLPKNLEITAESLENLNIGNNLILGGPNVKISLVPSLGIMGGLIIEEGDNASTNILNEYKVGNDSVIISGELSTIGEKAYAFKEGTRIINTITLAEDFNTGNIGNNAFCIEGGEPIKGITEKQYTEEEYQDLLTRTCIDLTYTGTHSLLLKIGGKEAMVEYDGINNVVIPETLKKDGYTIEWYEDVNLLTGTNINNQLFKEFEYQKTIYGKYIEIPVTPSAGGGQAITPTKQETKVREQEHNSADTEDQKTTNTQTNTQTSNVTTSEDIKKQVKIVEDKSLTRGEVAIMTNILLEVYPQLVEGKQELDDVTNACSNYADEKNFTKDEKKAITRLCKLSIMGIHNDTNEPLEEFLVNSKSTNDEFSKVINRSIETYNEKDLTTIKEALKKLEGDEENVVFGTVYDVFMSIKSIFN